MSNDIRIVKIADLVWHSRTQQYGIVSTFPKINVFGVNMVYIDFRTTKTWVPVKDLSFVKIRNPEMCVLHSILLYGKSEELVGATGGEHQKMRNDILNNLVRMVLDNDYFGQSVENKEADNAATETEASAEKTDTN